MAARPHDPSAADRLLHAAADEFGRRGYRDASVRQICGTAGVNVSAVKYHFGSKEELYRRVCGDAARSMIGAEPMPRLRKEQDPRETLADFMAWFMRLVLLDGEAQTCMGQLLAHEAVEATNVLDTFVDICAGPIHKELHRIVRTIVGPGVGRTVSADLTNGIIALCVNLKHSREILTRLGHPPPTTRAAINRKARHLARFALCGLDNFADAEDRP
jgi:AcrR family transcriptional regulator